MVPARFVLAVAGALALAGLPACNDSDADPNGALHTTSAGKDNRDPAGRAARITECPRAVSGGLARSCTLVYRDVRLVACGDGGPGGFDLMASGVSCAEARSLRVTLGARGFNSWRRPGEAIYRPWLAAGTFSDAEPIKRIGWTCWKRWDPSSKIEDGVRNVCWSDHGSIVLFKQA